MRSKTGKKKAQSAMEYLMTYSWAIVIIAVVIFSMYELGIFGNGFSGANAQPGSCQISRPEGPLSILGIALAGVCSGELPEFVAQTTSPKHINVPTSVAAVSGSFTSTAWVLAINPTNNWDSYVSFHDPSAYGWQMDSNPPPAYGNTGYARARFDTSGGSNQVPTGPSINIKDGRWHFVVLVFNKVTDTAQVYTDGVAGTSKTITGTVPNTTITSAVLGNWPGDLANVQIYNTTLSANDIQALYIEGIGGAPLVLQDLVAWWPLNGNPVDYSGDNFTGTISTLTFTSSWTSGYTAP